MCDTQRDGRLLGLKWGKRATLIGNSMKVVTLRENGRDLGAEMVLIFPLLVSHKNRENHLKKNHQYCKAAQFDTNQRDLGLKSTEISTVSCKESVGDACPNLSPPPPPS